MCDSKATTETTEKKQGLPSRLQDLKGKGGLPEVENMEEIKTQPEAERGRGKYLGFFLLVSYQYLTLAEYRQKSLGKGKREAVCNG